MARYGYRSTTNMKKLRRSRKPLSERKPCYPDGETQRRIVSVANGLWVPQVFIGPGGDNRKDGWRDVRSPMSKSDAMHVLKYRNIEGSVNFFVS